MQALHNQSTEHQQTHLDLPRIAERLRQVMHATGFDGKEFAAKSGVPYTTMRGYLGGRPPSAEFLTGAYRAFGASPIYLLTGHGDPFVGRDPSPQTDGFVTIGFLPSPALLKVGELPEEEALHATPGMSVSRDWLAKRKLDVKALAVVRVRGRAMEELLWEGDTVLVDTSDTRCETGYVYVLRQGDELLVRFCQQLPGTVLRVSCRNPSFTPYDVDLAKVEDVQVVGRVVASSHEF